MPSWTRGPMNSGGQGGAEGDQPPLLLTPLRWSLESSAKCPLMVRKHSPV